MSEQWGIGIVTVLYTMAWFRGVWVLWLQRRPHDQAVAKKRNPPGSHGDNA